MSEEVKSETPHRCNDLRCGTCFTFIRGRPRRIVETMPGYCMERNERGNDVPVHRYTAVITEEVK